VGVSFAKSLAWARSIPVIPVHHLAGHIESLVLAHGELPYPAAVLVVSGGHTSLYLVSAPGAYRLVGRTRDDAAGEAYDKTAKLLGLGYPGGPAIDRLAREGRDDAVDLPATRLTHADRNDPRATGAGLLPADVARRTDFSFSGLKTAVLRLVRERTGRASAGTAASADDAGSQLAPRGCRHLRELSTRRRGDAFGSA
jgi:N6-L-threonylcarbamoyladenine synthase